MGKVEAFPEIVQLLQSLLPYPSRKAKCLIAQNIILKKKCVPLVFNPNFQVRTGFPNANYLQHQLTVISSHKNHLSWQPMTGASTAHQKPGC